MKHPLSNQLRHEGISDTVQAIGCVFIVPMTDCRYPVGVTREAGLWYYSHDLATGETNYPIDDADIVVLWERGNA